MFYKYKLANENVKYNAFKEEPGEQFRSMKPRFASPLRKKFRERRLSEKKQS